MGRVMQMAAKVVYDIEVGHKHLGYQDNAFTGMRIKFSLAAHGLVGAVVSGLFVWALERGIITVSAGPTLQGLMRLPDWLKYREEAN